MGLLIIIIGHIDAYWGAPDSKYIQYDDIYPGNYNSIGFIIFSPTGLENAHDFKVNLVVQQSYVRESKYKIPVSSPDESKFLKPYHWSTQEDDNYEAN